MLFHNFRSQEERRKFGGSDFIELQYCKLKQGTKIEKIISVDAIKHWKNESLYIFGDDFNVFYSYYREIFTGGIYNNGESGSMDMCGINYYSSEQSGIVIEQVRKNHPLDYQVLLNWLKDVKKYNGFYILGI